MWFGSNTALRNGFVEQPGWEALLPTLCVIAAAILLRSTIPALVLGVVVATVLSGNDALRGAIWAIGMVAAQQLF